MSLIFTYNHEPFEFPYPLPFQLTSLETNLAGYDSLHSFLNSQLTISALYWKPTGLRSIFFDGLQLPNLTTLDTNIDQVFTRRLISGRNIKSLTTRQSVDRLVNGLQPMPSMEELCNVRLDRIDLLADVFPNLQWLEGYAMDASPFHLVFMPQLILL